jgi:hypothetical protein
MAGSVDEGDGSAVLGSGSADMLGDAPDSVATTSVFLIASKILVLP